MSLLEHLKSLPRKLTAHADALKAAATTALKETATGVRETIGPTKAKVARQPERAFGRGGGEDVKGVVWTGHVVQSPTSQSYYGAVGLTDTGYYRTAEVQVFGGGEEKWRWDTERHTGKYAAQSFAEAQAQKRVRLKPPVPAPKTRDETQHKVIAPDYFPNVWRAKGVKTPSGTLVGVVNRDNSDHQFYAGVHHFPKAAEQDVAIRWAHQPHSTMGQAIEKAKTFVRRGTRSIKARHEETKKLAKEHHEDAQMGGVDSLVSKTRKATILRYKPRQGPKTHR